MQIRVAAESDIPSVLSLYTQLDQSGEVSMSLPDALEIFRHIESYPNYHIYVAEQHGELIGTFALLIMDNLAHGGTKSALLEAAVVDEKFRGAGIGKKMMLYAMELCEQNLCYKVCLSSNFKREDAHRFYDSLGFQKQGFSFQINFDS